MEVWDGGETGLGMRFPPAYAGKILTVFDKIRKDTDLCRVLKGRGKTLGLEKVMEDRNLRVQIWEIRSIASSQSDEATHKEQD